jgi:hypothetical protein
MTAFSPDGASVVVSGGLGRFISISDMNTTTEPI